MLANVIGIEPESYSACLSLLRYEKGQTLNLSNPRKIDEIFPVRHNQDVQTRLSHGPLTPGYTTCKIVPAFSLPYTVYDGFCLEAVRFSPIVNNLFNQARQGKNQGEQQ